MNDPSEFKPGLYQHYKGGYYLAFYLVRHHEGYPLVVYLCCERGTMAAREWARPGSDSWSDLVQVSPVSPTVVPRFKYVGPLGMEIPR